MGNRYSLFVRSQFEGAQSLEEAFHRTLGPKAALMNPNIYKAMREAFFSGAAALDSMQSEVMMRDKSAEDASVTAKRLAALMDKLSSEIRER